MKFPVVGIAASAGGLEAVSELLGGVPIDSGLAYVVIQHLDPDHKSLLTELLQKHASIPVQLASEGRAVERNQVYVIPPAAALTVANGAFHLEPRLSGAAHMPADIFLRSLAEEYGECAIGVVLSGGDSDGTLGVQAVKATGGITFAQDPQSARVPSMPSRAIESGCIDLVLRPKQIAAELNRLGRHSYLQPATPRGSSAEAVDVQLAPNEEILRRIFRQLRSKAGVDFTHYKRSTLERRLARRMAVRTIDSAENYLELLLEDPAELSALFQEFLIRVTRFFRDAATFEALAREVFPRLFEGRGAHDPIRIWVPGCATGEEVYSIAMALVEYLGDRPSAAQIQIFGTDIAEPAIEKARSGCYPDTIAQDVSAERLTRFFVKEDGHYRIAKSIRDLCIFARHDITHDPPFSRLDLISCRNLLIYLDASAQMRVMQVFHYSLRPHGMLMLGPSESVGQSANLFDLADKRHRFYTRKVSLGVGDDVVKSRARPVRVDKSIAQSESAWLSGDGKSALFEADRILLARYSPASVLVDHALDVLQFRGETGAYLEHASGLPSLNLQRLARSGLLVELTRALDEARDSGHETRRDGLHVNGMSEVSVEVVPINRDGAQFFLILFQDGARARADGGRPTPQLSESQKDRRLAQLETEVTGLREYLQVTVERHEAVNEDLKTAHEEVLSANEEFQSTNEELETSKEELQSTNEELTTTIEELGSRNVQLAHLNAELEKARTDSERARIYADAIVDTVREPLVVLDGDLKLRRANKAYYAAFDVSPPNSESNPLLAPGAGLWGNAELHALLREVLTQSTNIVDYEVSHVTRAGPRLFCVNARRIADAEGRPELILLALDDITDRRASNDVLRDSNRHKDEFLAMLAHELRNPLGPILNAIHMLRRVHADPDATRLYAMVERQTQRMAHIVDELLDIARIDRGLIDIRREPVELVSIVRSAVDAVRPRIDERRMVLAMALPESPVHVEGDAMRLEQVVSNLLDNAIKYTDTGGRISLAVTEKNREVGLVVRDNGIGLAPDKLDAIFDLFTQADRTLARSSGGLGIGLNVARRLTELHGGRIEARSAGLGQGSEFIVWLPVLPRATPAEPMSTPRHTTARRRNQPCRVMVVDDNGDSAESTAMLARVWGHEVACAFDGPAALALAESFQPQIALLDVGLPGMDGYELARRLRANTSQGQMLLVAMTGYGREEDRIAARTAGFDLHLVKPATDELQKLLATENAP